MRERGCEKRNRGVVKNALLEIEAGFTILVILQKLQRDRPNGEQGIKRLLGERYGLYYCRQKIWPEDLCPSFTMDVLSGVTNFSRTVVQQ
jgi:hypothetical protein